MSVGRFYAAVSVLLWRASDGKYLVLKRSADKDFAGDMWECTTGRVDQGEGFIGAVHREVREELGIDVQIDFVIGTLHFYRGAPVSDNEMVGVHYCCSLEGNQDVHLSWEHSEYRWVNPAEADLLLPTGHWLRPVIRRAEAIRALSPPELLDYHRATGFGL